MARGYPWTLGVGCLLLAMVLAGCAGGDVEPNVATPPSIRDGTGSVEGLVQDDEGLPVAGALVGAIGTQAVATTTTGADGRFTLLDLLPGHHTVQAQKIGYGDASKSVRVVEGQAASLDLQLSRIQVSAPYSEVIGPFQGFFECKASFTTVANGWTGNCGSVCAPVHGCEWAPGDLWPNDQTLLQFEMSSDDYRAFVGEMRWTQGSYATSTELRMSFSHDDRVSSHWFCSGEGPSPLLWRYEKAAADAQPECHGASVGGSNDPPEPSTDLGLRVYSNVPFARVGTGNPTGEPFFLALQQNFEMLVTIFYGEGAPETYSGFPDL